MCQQNPFGSSEQLVSVKKPSTHKQEPFSMTHAQQKNLSLQVMQHTRGLNSPTSDTKNECSSYSLGRWNKEELHIEEMTRIDLPAVQVCSKSQTLEMESIMDCNDNDILQSLSSDTIESLVLGHCSEKESVSSQEDPSLYPFFERMPSRMSSSENSDVRQEDQYHPSLVAHGKKLASWREIRAITEKQESSTEQSSNWYHCEETKELIAFNL